MVETDENYYYLSIDSFGLIMSEEPLPDIEVLETFPIGIQILDVRSDNSFIILQLSNGDYISYGLSGINGDGTMYYVIEIKHGMDIDDEFLDWFNNDMERKRCSSPLVTMKEQNALEMKQEL